MSLINQALTTVSAVQGEYRVDDEDVVARVINAVSQDMASVAGGRVWHYAAAHTYKASSYGRNRLYLPSPPLISIASAVLQDVSGVDQHTYQATYYGIEGDGGTGILLNSQGWHNTAFQLEGFSNFARAGSVAPLILVTYEGGWVTPWQVDPKNPSNLIGTQTRNLPYNLEEACIADSVSRLRARGRDLTLETQTTEAASATFRRPQRGHGGLSAQAYDTARKYWLGRP
ncbi:MAG: hypothetical protein JKY94_16800 [Rhodobacteraceae bacterium]|nr:hypothetical protein [Paracoccaceae bacterium]